MQPALKSSERSNSEPVVLVDPARLDASEERRLMDLLASLLTKAGATDMTADSLKQDIANRHVQVWRIGDWEAVAITRLVGRPKGPILAIDGLAGAGMTKWIEPLTKAMEMHGRMMGCRQIEFTTSRNGWEFWRRRFPDFEPKYVTYCKEI